MKLIAGWKNVTENLFVFSSQIYSIYIVSFVILIMPFTIGKGPFIDINPFYGTIFPVIFIASLEIENLLTHKRKLRSNYLKSPA